MGHLIDTSVFIDAERSQTSLRDLLERVGPVDSVAISAVTVSELLHGVHRADGALRRGRREAFVNIILDAVPILPFDAEVAAVHSRVWADLVQRGEMITAHDLMIGATALTHGHVLVSRDQHFSRIEGLELIVL